MNRYLLLVGLVSGTVWADECQDLSAELEYSTAQHDYAAALGTIAQIEDNFCVSSPIKIDALKKPVLRAWGDKLFHNIFGDDEVKFGPEQTERLRVNKDEIQAAWSAANVQIQDAWQIAFLKLILDEDENEVPLMTPQAYKRMDGILSGYVADFYSGTLSKAAQSAKVDEFVKQLMEAGLLKIEPNKLVGVTRGNGASALTELIKVRSTGNARGARFSSSTQQPAVAVTPIRFKYDSTVLTAQGVNEYQENLGNMLANTTDHIFLIGHTDKKGSAEYNCWLSQCRVKAMKKQLIHDGVPAAKIEIAWAGENIPLSFGQAATFLQQRDIAIVDTDEADPALRRVEYELNGDTLKEKYRGQFCTTTRNFAQKPCDFE